MYQHKDLHCVLSLMFVVNFSLQGWVIIENFFDKSKLDVCRDAVDVLVDELANKLYKGGKIKGKVGNDLLMLKI